jgi:hypothetical protein
MASATYLSNPVVTIGGTDLTDMCSAATLNHLVEALEDTALAPHHAPTQAAWQTTKSL